MCGERRGVLQKGRKSAIYKGCRGTDGHCNEASCTGVVRCLVGDKVFVNRAGGR